jgi:hypothetical protein
VEVAGVAADHGPVLLLDECLVVLVAGASAGERDPPGLAPAGQVVVDELGPVVGVDPGEVEREPQLQFGEPGRDELLAFGTDRDGLGQPVAISVASRE